MEIHLFIIWSKAVYKKKDILSDISNKFSVLDIYNITWSENMFADNLSRFYGQNLPKNSHKEQHCGNGTFTCIIVKDEKPIYDSRETSKGIRVVNTNLFDSKKLYRSWTDGGHKIHATDNINETRLQLMLLVKRSYDSYIESSSITLVEKEYNNDLIASNGWHSLIELFDVLNLTINYVILRNFESIEDEMNSLHPDIDILTDDIYSTISILNAKKTSRKKYRVQYNVLIDNQNINFDLRFQGDNYYDLNWQKDILLTRIRESFYYRPSAVNYYYSLLYHALLHKPKLGPDYARRLLELREDTSVNPISINSMKILSLLNNLREFINTKKYQFTYPSDYSVYWNYQLYSKRNPSSSLFHRFYRMYCEFKRIIGYTKKKYAGILVSYLNSSKLFLRYHTKIKKGIMSLDINEIKIYNFKRWHDGFAYYTGRINGKIVFIKVSTKHFFLDNEQIFYNIFKDDLSLLKLIHVSKNMNIQILVSEFEDSKELSSKDIVENPDILLEIYKILKTINSKECIHRDIKLNNFLIIDKELRIIDFTYSTCLERSDRFKDLSIDNNNYSLVLENLGGKYRKNILEWNDFYSMALLIDEIIIEDIDVELRSKILEYQKLFRNNIEGNSYSLRS